MRARTAKVICMGWSAPKMIRFHKFLSFQAGYLYCPPDVRPVYRWITGYPLDVCAGYPPNGHRIVRAGFPAVCPPDVRWTSGEPPSDPTERQGFGNGTGTDRDWERWEFQLKKIA